MPYLNLDFSPGMQANGTVYQNRFVWLDGDRVRWHNNALRPIGGWDRATTSAGQLDQVLTDPTNQKARTLLAWRKNDGSAVYVAGHNEGLAAWSRASNTVYDITPAGFTPRAAGPLIDDGYGYWLYGQVAYGTPRPYETEDIFNWCFRLWGENLLAAPRIAPSNLYVWNASLSTPAALVPGASVPTNFDCFHVTEQRIVMTAGSSGEPRLIQWSSSEDYSDWTPSVTNQAGFQTLPGIGKFKEIVTVRDQILLISETDAHVARYLGPPYVYGFDAVGDDCGIISGGSVVVTEDFAIWPGARDFYIYDGSLRRLECPLMDRLAGLINNPNAGKLVGFNNPQWAEAWWLFQSGTDDTDTYIAYDWKEDHWQTGTLDRSVGGGHPILQGPIMIGQDGYAYEHEQSDVAPYDTSPAEVYVESGPIEISPGDQTQYIESIQPDLIDNGSVDITLLGRDRPTSSEIQYGPYVAEYPAAVDQPIATRARGHTVRMRVTGKSGLFTMGSMRLGIKGGGRK